MLWVVAAVAAAVVVAVIALVNMNAKNPFESAVEECGLKSSSDVRVLDEGKTLVVNSKGSESDGVSVDTLACVLVALDVPDSVVAKMESTRALDGSQSDDFAGIKAQWSYHPDDGLDIIFTR